MLPFKVPVSRRNILRYNVATSNTRKIVQRSDKRPQTHHLSSWQFAYYPLTGISIVTDAMYCVTYIFFDASSSYWCQSFSLDDKIKSVDDVTNRQPQEATSRKPPPQSLSNYRYLNVANIYTTSKSFFGTTLVSMIQKTYDNFSYLFPPFSPPTPRK